MLQLHHFRIIKKQDISATTAQIRNFFRYLSGSYFVTENLLDTFNCMRNQERVKMRMKRTFAGVLAGVLALSMLAVPARAAYDAADTTDVSTETAAAQAETAGQGDEELPAPAEESVVDAADMAGAAGLDAESIQDDFSALWGVTGQNWDENTADEVDGIALFSEEADDSDDYVFLSDRDYEPGSKAGHGDLMQNLAPNGKTIQLLVNGTPTEFEKGMGAHATSTLIYDIGELNDTYTQLSFYAGVDYSQNGKGNGVWFSVSGSNDLNGEWTELTRTEVLTPGKNAEYLCIPVDQYRYIQLYANDNGANGNDHAVYGDLRLLKDGYDIRSELYTGFKTLEEYDAALSQNSVEDNYTAHRQEVLERAFVARVGYQSIQNAVKAQPNVREALEWLRSDTNALQLFLEAGNLYNGSGYKTLTALGNLYQAAKDDIGDSGDALVYKKMMLATAVAYCKTIVTYMVGFGGNAYPSDPVVKYTTFKKLYDEGYFLRKEEFKTYPMELVRYVMDSKTEDSEILWLREYVESKYPDNLTKRLNPYTFVRYYNISYSQAQFYDPAKKDTWNAKYDFLRYGVTYGEKDYFHLWMMMEVGGICWGISGMGLSINETHGIPAVNTYQPAHEAYLLYTQNDKGEGIWSIWNNVSGWASSYTRWGWNTGAEARILLGWGQMDYNKVDGGNNTSYILLSQAALNRYNEYLQSWLYKMVADVYPAGSEKHEQALDRSLECLDLNLDALYGKVKSYRADPNTTEEEWAALARQVIKTYTYYPAPMVDLLGQITRHITTGSVLAELNTLKYNALKQASAATANESLQPDACRAVANSLLGSGSVALATFSFDGDNAGCIVLDPSYDNYELMVRVSLDGSNNWEKFPAADGSEIGYTPEHKIQLTPDQLARISADSDIKVGLTGTDVNHTIDIKAGKTLTATTLYANDDENLLFGDTAFLEYSTDGGAHWADYTGGLDSTVRFTGDTAVTVRYKAHGVYLQSSEYTYRFTPENYEEGRQYLPLRYVTLEDFSSQNSTSADHAAKNFIDGNAYTAWHTTFGVSDPGKYYTVQFDKPRAITRLTYLPGGQNGRLKAGEVYVSQDGQDWTLVKTFSDLPNTDKLKTIDIEEPVPARYLKIVATSTYYNSEGEKDRYFSGKMLNFYEDPTLAEDLPASVTYSVETPTRDNVTATLVLPDGCRADVTEHLFEDNDTYTFTYYDSLNREKTIDAVVSWIDRTAPEGTIVYSPAGWTNGSVTATVQADEEVTFLDGSDGTHTFDDNESYTFRMADAAGNETELEARVAWIDKTKPADADLLTVTNADNASTVTLNIDPAAVEVLSVNGEATDSNVLSALENGTYTFRLRLRDTGYEFEYAVLVNWLDSGVPAVSTPAPTAEPTPTPTPAVTELQGNVVTVYSEDAPAAESTPAPLPVVPSLPTGTQTPAATKAPAATAKPSATPAPTATPTPAVTPAPTTAPAVTAAPESTSAPQAVSPKPAPGTKTVHRWPLVALGAGLLCAAVVIGLVVFLPHGRKYR